MSKIGNFNLTLVFLLGDGDDGATEVLMNEAKAFGDILVGNFTDIYDNLPLKTYLGYQYFSNECVDIPHVVFQGLSQNFFSSVSSSN